LPPRKGKILPTTKRYARIARSIASPFILRILKPISGQQLGDAIRKDNHLVAWLDDTPEAARKLKILIGAIPYSREALPYVKEKAWIEWFVANELQHKRPDLHVQFQYLPNAESWLQRNIEELIDFLLG